MSGEGGVSTVTVADSDDGLRLDKWFKEHYPGLTFGRLQKLLRKGEVRVDGKRVKDAKFVLATGQTLRLPPLDKEREPGRPKTSYDRVSAKDAHDIQACVLHKDDHILILDKPAGLAVQGGSGTTKHIDGLLDALKFGLAERPRLVHRLDKDTSGVLVLARSQNAARVMTEAFRRSEEHTSELQSHHDLVCRLLLEKKKQHNRTTHSMLRSLITPTSSLNNENTPLNSTPAKH